jgi:hypothetical protein
MAPRKTPPVEEETPAKFDPKSKTLKIETGNDIYEIEKPTGKLGALHFRLLTKAMPKSTIIEPVEQIETDETTGEPVIDEKTGEPKVIIVEEVRVSPADEERMQEVFEQWIADVLPHIVISHKYDDLPGEDQWAIFIASFHTMRVRQDLFRLVA